MQFLYPSFLFALASVAIPILIHLFHLRKYKKIVFSDIRFLKEIQEQTRSNRKLKDWLILLARVFTIASLVIAFAQPYIPANKTTTVGQQKVVSIFIDNSASMSIEGERGILLEDAKQKAKIIVEAQPKNTGYQIQTHSHNYGQWQLLSAKEAVEKIAAIQLTETAKNMSQIYAQQQVVFEKNNNANKTVYLVSDFQKNAFAQLLSSPSDSTVEWNIVALKANNANNLSIDTIWLKNPFIKQGEPTTFSVKISNHGNESVNDQPVSLVLDGNPKGLVNVSIDAKSSTVVEITSTANANTWTEAYIELKDFPLSFDDRLYFTFKPTAQYRVVAINGTKAQTNLTALFKDDNEFDFVSYGDKNINYQTWANAHLIVLNQCESLTSGTLAELLKYTKNGGQVLFIPSADAQQTKSINTLLTDMQLPAYGELKSQQVKADKLNLTHPIFKGVFANVPKNSDVPTAQKYYTLQVNGASRGQAVIAFNAGEALLWQASVGKGRFNLLTTPLNDDWTSFHRHALFVPVMLKLGNGVAQNNALYYTIGYSEKVFLSPGEERFLTKSAVLKNESNEWNTTISTLDEKSVIYLDKSINKAGIYGIFAGNSKNIIEKIALNYNRNESDTRYLNEDDLSEWQSKSAGRSVYTEQQSEKFRFEINKQYQGQTLWRYFAVLALIFIAAEIAMLRLLKS